MSLQHIVWLGIAVVIFAGSWMFSQRRKLAGMPYASDARAVGISPKDMALSVSGIPATATKSSLSHAIVLGEDAQRPGVRIAPLSDSERFRTAKAISTDSGLSARLSAGLQAVPALLVEEGHRGKQLMEVVISGELVRAKDGVGLRAWTVGTDNKISEHAKLFDANELQNMVNAAAVWQVASVIVAQKHLADITEKLEDIRKGIQGVAHFQDDGRRANVTGTYEYLEQVASAIAKGELSPAIRNQLESCDVQLLQTQHHLQQELERRCTQPIEHKEIAGTSDLEKKAVAKYQGLIPVAMDLRLTLKTRVLAWHVLSLYPGEPALKHAKMEGLMRSAEEIERQFQTVETSAGRDCQQFSSFWNKEETLAIRRDNVRDAAKALASDLRDVASQAKDQVNASSASLLAHDQQTYILFEVEHGRIGEFRVAEAIPRLA